MPGLIDLRNFILIAIALHAGAVAPVAAQDTHVQVPASTEGGPGSYAGPPPQSQGKDINLPFVNIHIGHGVSVNAPFAHVDKMPGMPAQVNAPYTNVQSSLGSNGTHVRAPFTGVDTPGFGYRGEPVHVRAPFTHVGESQYGQQYRGGAPSYSLPEHAETVNHSF